MQRTRPKHGRRSYLSVGIGGDSQSLLEREPLRCKDRGLLSYNIDSIVPATSSHLRFGAKVGPRGRWPPNIGALTRKSRTVVGTLQKWPAKAGGRSPKGPAVAGTTVFVCP